MTKEWVAAFDPGKVNFAFIVEEIDTDVIKSLVCPPKNQRFVNEKKEKRLNRNDAEPSDSYIKFLENFYHSGHTILCVNSDITRDNVNEDDKLKVKKPRKTKAEKEAEVESKNDEPKKKRGSKALDANVFLRLTALLDRYKEQFDKCTTIIIEQQMSFGSKINTMAIKIAQHTYSYFLFRYGNTKKIVEFPSYNKTQIMGAPGGLDKPLRKKWAVVKADEIWTLRGDMETSTFVQSNKKKDDLSDCLLHVLSYIIMTYY
uniref:Mitochondrial resolvase Ydc2 catalytic domain-containing protein n=1 Tax=viral metagenome TaxID=1070528 RepID=A0A6C0KCG9_9ZZZZ